MRTDDPPHFTSPRQALQERGLSGDKTMSITQDGRLLSLTTPLGKDFLLIQRFVAREGLSELFQLEAELVHEEEDGGRDITVVDPRKIVGQTVTLTVTSTDSVVREFTGIVNRFTQGHRDDLFTHYRISVVPHVWMLTQRVRSRIFQHKTVPDILADVFADFEVKYEFSGKYEPRNYCVQYQESDFDFASRLMEEEGMFYFFEHSGGALQMMVADSPQSHRDCPGRSDIPFTVGNAGEEGFLHVISSLSDDYRLQTGKVTLWDYNFQIPTNKLNLEQPSLYSFGENQKLETYHYPGGYARKYDGVDKGGGESAEDLNKVFDDRLETVKRMMEGLDARVRTVSGQSDCVSLTPGYRFNLQNHPAADYNKPYVVTGVRHQAEQSPNYDSASGAAPYTNQFTSIVYGAGQPTFRPQRTTAKPVINGSQTAVVVGPSGEEIFTDKFGRVKVQFHWDREGQVDANSSCWVRVAQSFAGNKWGGVFIPRIGMEVIVHFMDGDPDQPIITGCVYNPLTMPPYTLPDEKTKSTMKTNSSKGGGGFNEIRFEDKKGSEQIFIHAQKDVDMRVRKDRRELIGNDRHLIVRRDKREKVERDAHAIVERDNIKQVVRDYHLSIGGKFAFGTSGSFSYKIDGDSLQEVGGDASMAVSGNLSISANQIVLDAQTGLTISVGGNFVTITPAGVQINGTTVLINSGGTALKGMPGIPVNPVKPEEAEIADVAEPGSGAPTYRSQRASMPPTKRKALESPSHDPKKNKDKKSWVEIELNDEDGNPVPGEKYLVTLPDGSTVASGTLDEKGKARVENIDPGSCKITFPDLDKDRWKKK